MQSFFREADLVARSKWFFIYWGICLTGSVAQYFNSGLKGRPLYGAITIASFFLGFVAFYWHLGVLRRQSQFPQDRTGGGMFVRIYAFRLLLLGVMLVASVLPFFRDRFNSFTTIFTMYFAADPAEKMQYVREAVRVGWPFIVLYLVWLIVDQAARAAITARGTFRAAFLEAARYPALCGSIALYVLLEVALLSTNVIPIALKMDGEAKKQFELLLSAVLLPPAYYLLEMGMTLVMAKKILKRDQPVA